MCLYFGGGIDLGVVSDYWIACILFQATASRLVRVHEIVIFIAWVENTGLLLRYIRRYQIDLSTPLKLKHDILSIRGFLCQMNGINLWT